jgi:hypothetical protein
VPEIGRCNIFVPKANCPDIVPRNVHLAAGVDVIKPTSEDWRVGFDAHGGVEGEGLKCIAGFRVGLATHGDSIFAKVWNLTSDRGVYSDVQVTLQKWLAFFNSGTISIPVPGQSGSVAVATGPCVCLRGDISLEPSLEWGWHVPRVAGFALAWVGAASEAFLVFVTEAAGAIEAILAAIWEILYGRPPGFETV